MPHPLITHSDTTLPSRGVVLFDATCPLCQGLVRRTLPLLTQHGWGVMPLQDPLAPTLSSLPVSQLHRAITVCPCHAPSCQGVAAIELILSSMPRTRWLGWLLRRPTLKPLWQWGYARIARHRFILSRWFRLHP